MRVAREPLCLFVVCLAACVELAAITRVTQVAPRGTGMISGLVVDAATGRPLPGSVVHTAGASTAVVSRRQLSDSQGRFAFADLPALSRVLLTASHPGYLEGGFSSSSSPGMMNAELDLADGEWLRDVQIRLWRPSSISGTIVDEIGEAIVGVTVMPIGIVHVAGHDRFATGTITTTDDRGHYRLSGLVPGRYVVAVPSSQPSSTALASQFPVPPPRVEGRPRAYPMTFAPGITTISNAGRIELGRGIDRAGVDIQLRPVPAAAITGRVSGAGASAGRALRLLPGGLETLGLGTAVQVTRVAADGTFRFEDVPAGDYSIDAPLGGAGFWMGASQGMARYPQPPGQWNESMRRFNPTPAAGNGVLLQSSRADGDPTTWGRTPVAVQGETVSNVVVTLHAAAHVRGRVVFETALEGAERERATSAILFAEPATGESSFGLPEGRTDRSDPERSFVISGLGPTTYVLRPPSGRWIVKSVTLDGRDVTHTPLDATSRSAFDDVVMTVSDQHASISGVVRDGAGDVVSGAEVVVFPSDRGRWINYGLTPADIKSAHSSPAGVFRVTDLPGGDYLVVALPPDAPDWHRSGFFDEVAATAERVQLDWGGSATRDVQTVRR